jgi:hypothetical protein
MASHAGSLHKVLTDQDVKVMTHRNLGNAQLLGQFCDRGCALLFQDLRDPASNRLHLSRSSSLRTSRQIVAG